MRFEVVFLATPNDIDIARTYEVEQSAKKTLEATLARRASGSAL
jgi:hypothetical protein